MCDSNPTHMKWHRRWLQVLNNEIKNWSKDDSTKVGAAIINPNHQSPLTLAFNGFARGVDEEIKERWERPAKYAWVAHAEENAIINCARTGQSTEGMYLYCTEAPCPHCARKIVQAGIAKVIVDAKAQDSAYMQRHKEDFEKSLTMFFEAGVSIEFVKTKV